MNYYEELNEGFNKYIMRELDEDVTSLNESLMNEANPFKRSLGTKAKNLFKGIKEGSTYFLDGKEMSADKITSGMQYLGINLSPELEKKLQTGDEVEVKGEDGKTHTLQMKTTSTNRTDRKIDKLASKTTKDGKLSDEGRINIKELTSSNGSKQYALFLGSNNRIAVYPSYDVLKQVVNSLRSQLSSITK